MDPDKFNCEVLVGLGVAHEASVVSEVRCADLRRVGVEDVR
jgi:hypothetical protein